ncbi:hypothetical protein Y032_0093g2631 [Ancylostoma ceylanicum]|uniref:Uncharacterized protein n=1 Tax=Ancylostoma ceylanicum TaxID=53326 RepID=A0A016TLI8_9BILA|nr:hypothetical protein Y032_0093g2631 [Ancylostoma ceylanicum]
MSELGRRHCFSALWSHEPPLLDEEKLNDTSFRTKWHVVSHITAEMWMLICFFLPALLFCLCAFIAWLRVLRVNKRREKRETCGKYIDTQRTKQKNEVVCSIPIRVVDVETGKTFIYSSNEEIRPEC